MKNIASNIVDFINKLRIGKMIRIVMKNKWVLLSLVFLILFYYFFYSIKEGVTNSPEDAPEDVEQPVPPMTQITEGAFDTSINFKIQNIGDQIATAETEAEEIKTDMISSIENIQDSLDVVGNLNAMIKQKFPEPSSE